jgi:hypothetical protein
MSNKTNVISEADLKKFYELVFEFMKRNPEYLADYKTWVKLTEQRDLLAEKIMTYGAEKPLTEKLDVVVKKLRAIANKHRLVDMLDPADSDAWKQFWGCRKAVVIGGDASLSEVELSGFVSDIDSPYVKTFHVDLSRSDAEIEAEFKILKKILKDDLKKKGMASYKQFNDCAKDQLLIYDLKRSGTPDRKIAEQVYSSDWKVILRSNPTPTIADLETVIQKVKKNYRIAKAYVKNGYKLNSPV